jgi:hypothetical protein
MHLRRSLYTLATILSAAVVLAACSGSDGDDEHAAPVVGETKPATIYTKLGPPVGEPTQPAPTATTPGTLATATATPRPPCSPSYTCLR